MWFKKKRIQEVLGINERNASFIYPNNPRKHYKLADDKVMSKTILHEYNIPCAKTYAVIERIGDIVSVWKTLDAYDTLAIKPSKGFGGGGIKILRKDGEGRWVSGGKVIEDEQVYHHMANIIMGIYSLGGKDRVLIEECIEPHPFFHEIYPSGVPDFRVILLNQKPLMSMLRVPTKKSNGKANLHQGGIGIGIDMKNGVLTQGYDGSHYMDLHPDSQSLIAGKAIPFWEEILKISIETSKHFPLNYLGVDIVLDAKKGPMIMEVNVRPGLGIQLVNKTGLKKTLQQVG
ncbi:sugar-transfer associated ATP-grasp domain-containing protein [Winogradskyella sp. 3972H.M.0a.05]|uniref:sugar-transfer associated ATP-grasp domain-containing protein n=1 Tax=Winogradskyella sp. 3972H.M.0a.05 TaxID=2950277 RepID=UPI00339714A8